VNGVMAVDLPCSVGTALSFFGPSSQSQIYRLLSAVVVLEAGAVLPLDGFLSLRHLDGAGQLLAAVNSPQVQADVGSFIQNVTFAPALALNTNFDNTIATNFTTVPTPDALIVLPGERLNFVFQPRPASDVTITACRVRVIM